MGAIIKIYFSFFFLTERPLDLKVGRKHQGDLQIKKKKKKKKKNRKKKKLK